MLYCTNNSRFPCRMTDMSQNNFHDRILCHKYLHKRLYMKIHHSRLYKMFCNFFHRLQSMMNYNRLYILFHNFLCS